MVTLNIRSSSEAKASVTIDVTTATVSDLKTEIEKVLPGFPAQSQRLIFSGKVLKDDDILQVYKIADGNTVHVVKSVARNPDPSTTTSMSNSTTPIHNSNDPTNSSNASTAAAANPFAAFAGLGGVPPTSGAAAAANPFANPMLAGMMGAGGIPGMGTGSGGMPDMSGMLSMLNSNPGMMNLMTQQMQQMFNNPQLLDAMASMNPALANPEYRSLMQNMMSNPEALRGMMSLASNPAMASMMGANAGTAAPGTGIPNPTPGMGQGMAGLNPFMMGMLGGTGSGNTTGSTPSVPVEERYATQLQQLAEMGMLDGERNLRALQLSGGNIHAAIEWLFNNPQ